MKKKFLAVFLVFAIFAQTVTIFAADVAFTNDVVDGNVEVKYIAGENNVNKKIKFAMDMGLIKKYIPAELATREDLRNALRLVTKDDSLYERYYTADNDNATISVDEAIVLFMDIAGYAPYIKMNTKADALAYRSEAQRRGMLTSINYSAASNRFTVEMFYNMFYDTLNMPIFGASYSNAGASYMQTKDTLMYTALKLIELRGVVNANSYASLKGGEPAGDEALVVGAVKYNTFGVKDVDAFLGFGVICFVNSDEEICSIAVDTATNNYTSFDEKVDVKYADKMNFEYYSSNNRTSTLKLNPYAVYMYNNVVAEKFKAKDLIIDNGSLKFIDNDGDNLYDVIFVEEFISFYPEFADNKAFVIGDVLGNEYDVADVASGRSYMGIHRENGTAVEIESITNNTLVSIGLIYETAIASEVIILDERTYEGTYSLYKANSNNPYTIGEKEFALSSIYAQEISNNFPFRNGDRIKLYLDQYGKIVKIISVANVEVYGYLHAIDSDEELFDSDVRVMILPEEGKPEVRSFAKKVVYNKNQTLSEDRFLVSSAVPELYNGENVKQQLIKYKLNAKGEIREIQTAKLNNSDWGAKKDGDDFQINFATKEGAPKKFMYYGNSVNAAQGKYRFVNTKVFNIPVDSADFFEYAHVSKISSLVDRDEYSMIFYDVDDYYIIGAAVQKINPSGEDNVVKGRGVTGGIFIDQGHKIDSKTGDVISYILYAKDGVEGNVDVAPRIVSAIEHESVDQFGARYASVKTANDLKPGDVIYWSTNYDGHMGIFKTVFAPDFELGFEKQVFEFDLYYNQTPTETRWGADTYMFAKVVSKDINGMVINADKGMNKFYNRSLKISSSRSVVVYDVSENEVSKDTFASVRPGDYVYVHYSDWKIVDIIVYRP